MDQRNRIIIVAGISGCIICKLKEPDGSLCAIYFFLDVTVSPKIKKEWFCSNAKRSAVPREGERRSCRVYLGFYLCSSRCMRVNPCGI